MNKVVLMGRLTADPEIKHTTGSEPITIAKFCLAVDKYTGSKEKAADFIYITAFRKTAEFVGKYFKKGNMLALEGKINTDKYKDKDGNNKTSFGVIAEQVHFCGGKNETNNTSETKTTGPDNDFYNVDNSVNDDDVPF